MTDYTEEQLQQRMGEVMALGRMLGGPSLAEQLVTDCSPGAELVDAQWVHAANDWQLWGRPKQLVVLDPEPPEWFPGKRFRWRIALAMGGRGMGKTRLGAEWVRHRIETGQASSICFIGPSHGDVRRTMVGGLPDTDSGFLDVLPPDVRAETTYNKNNQEIHVAPYGATIYLNTAEKPEQRGGNFDLVWGDEPIMWRYLDEVMQNLLMATRKPGSATQMLLTTTPKRQDWLRDLVMDPRTLVIHGTTAENSGNLSEAFIEDIYRRYAGTRIGLQELEAHILGDNDDALASQTTIDQLRVVEPPALDEVGVGIDPAVSTKRKSDDSGIVAAGRQGQHLYALEDRSGRYGANQWPKVAAQLAKDWGADFVIVERNKIGDAGVELVRAALTEAKVDIPIREAYSIKDKWTRALPVGALYEQGRAHHVGRLPTLETELTQWDPSTGRSPNSLDAFVHAAVELMGLARAPKPQTEKIWKGFAALNKRFERPRTF